MWVMRRKSRDEVPTQTTYSPAGITHLASNPDYNPGTCLWSIGDLAAGAEAPEGPAIEHSSASGLQNVTDR